MNDDTQREILTRKANLIRSRLEDKLDQLDRKRHVLEDAPQVVLSKVPVGAVVGGVAGALAIGVGLAIRRISHRPERLRRARLQVLKALWKDPERALNGRGTVWQELGRKILIGAVSFVAMELLKRATKQLLPPVEQGPSVVTPTA
jgi:hypothetical protein